MKTKNKLALAVSLCALTNFAAADDFCAADPGAQATVHTQTGNGSEAAPFEIWTAEQLWSMAHTPEDYDKHFVQCANIDLGDFYSNERPYFNIGVTDFDYTGERGDTGFSGSYDARRNAIVNFTMDANGPYEVGQPDVIAPAIKVTGARVSPGLFSKLECGAKVTNLRMRRATINYFGGATSVGMVAGDADCANLHTISASGAIVTDKSAVGGIVGEASSQSVLYNVHTNVSINIEGNSLSSAGGLVGKLRRSDVDRSSAWASVTGAGSRLKLGGAVGASFSDSVIERTQVHGNVKGGGELGGFIGYASDTYLVDSFSTGDVVDTATGSGEVGGFVGRMHTTSIERSFARGNVSSTALDGSSYFPKTLGGFAGEVIGHRWNRPGKSISDSFASGNVSAAGPVVAGGFVGSIWVVSEGMDGETPSVVANSYASGAVSTAGTAGGFAGAYGRNHDLAEQPYAYVENSFSTGKVSGAERSYGFGPELVSETNAYVLDDAVADQGPGQAFSVDYFNEPNDNFGFQWSLEVWSFFDTKLPVLHSWRDRD